MLQDFATLILDLNVTVGGVDELQFPSSDGQYPVLISLSKPLGVIWTWPGQFQAISQALRASMLAIGACRLCPITRRFSCWCSVRSFLLVLAPI